MTLRTAQRGFAARRGLRAVALAVLVVSLGAGVAVAAEVRGQDLGSHGRLEFSWNDPSQYRMLREGNRVIVDFDRQIGDGAAAAFRQVGRFIELGRVVGDGSTILIVLAPEMTLIDRQAGQSIVLELHPPEAAGELEQAHSAPSTAAVPMPDLDLSALPTPPTATNAPRPIVRVRGGEHTDYSRIVFDWPESVEYRVEQSGGAVRISFDTPADADFTRAAPTNLSRIDGLEQSGRAGGLTVAVAVAANSRLRHFRNGTKVVVDVLDGETTPAPAENASPAAAAATGVPADAAPEPTVPELVERPDPPPLPPRDPAARVPHAGAQRDPGQRPPAPAAEPSPAPRQTVMATDRPAEPREAGQPLSLLPERPPRRAPVVAEPLFDRPAEPIARFDPGTESALAVFRRGRSLWVVFASDSRLDANRLASQGSPALGAVDVVRAEGGIALRYQPGDAGDVVVSRRGSAWTVAIEPAAIRPGRTLEVVAQPDYPLGPRLLVDGGTGQGLVRLTDPLVGDVLIVAPIREAAVGLPDGARFAQLRLLPSVQGMVARPMSERIAMRVASDGIEISDVDGLLLSSATDTAREVIAIAPPIDIDDRLLEIDVWRGVEGEGFIAQRQAIQRALARAPEADRDRARLDFARFNFAHGYAQEALGLLELVEESQPSIAGRESFAVLRGAARILADEIEPGDEDLRHPGLAESRDAALWRAVAAAKLEDWPRAAAEFEKAGRLIETYPRPFAELLARLAARTAIEMNDPARAAGQLTRLSALTDGESDRWASTHYLRAVMARNAGDLPAATAAYEAAAASDDRYHRTLSELALIEIELTRGTLSREEAVASFESLRFAWRGDQIEMRLIDRIEGLHWQSGHYRRALETLQQAARSFPDTPAGEAFEARLRARFVELFGSDRVAAMPPLAAISLYRDYAMLMPNDDDGDRVLRGLAERLVEIDLLDQAGDILAELLETRLEGSDKARTGTRLAGIRLLSGQPEAALAALDASRTEARRLGALADERRLLRAHAMAQLGQAEEALDLLAGDRSPLAAAARADIAWRGQDWKAAAAALSDLVKPPPSAGASIADGDAQVVLNLGIALALADDKAGLERLARQYGPAMARSPSANTFAILTRSPGATPQIADLAAIRRQVSEVDLFQEFLLGYRRAGEPQG